MFSAVSSAFVIDIQSKLEPDSNEQSAALLRAILFTLNQSALPAETVAVPPLHEDAPSAIVTASGLMYASLLISLLAAFVAMLGNQWLNRYLRNTGGSVMERCGDRQRKWEGLEKWPLHLFVESLPVMLQVSLLLLACGLCGHMRSVNAPVTYVLVALTFSGILFYLGIVVAGTSSYECPFQTPASAALRSLRKAIRPQQFATILCSTFTLSRMNRALKRWTRHRFPRPSPLFGLGDVHSGLAFGGEVERPWTSQGPTLSQTNANDIRCVSWILRNITDREAIDAAIRLAGTIRWFDDGIDVEPPYDVIVSTFKSCFDSSDKVYPGSIERAYYSARAILQIRVFAMCGSRGFAHRFPHLHISDNTGDPGGDLNAIFQLCRGLESGYVPLYRRALSLTFSSAHLQWASNLLLQLSWAIRRDVGAFNSDINLIGFECRFWSELPPAVVPNCLLVWCIILGGDVDEGFLRIEDKSCVVFLSFLQKIHRPSSIVFAWNRSCLNFPVQS